MLIDMDIESKIATLLEEYSECTVVMSNQTSPMPEYPYISYTVTTPVHAENGTYCFKNGVYYQEMLQTWSFTAQSDGCRKCREIGMRMYDFFARAGRAKLQKIGTAVSSLTDVMNRDNYLTIQYEYRCGLDVTFRMMHVVDVPEERIEEEILKVKCKN